MHFVTRFGCHTGIVILFNKTITVTVRELSKTACYIVTGKKEHCWRDEVNNKRVNKFLKCP
jgi:hypothetical protein